MLRNARPAAAIIILGLALLLAPIANGRSLKTGRTDWPVHGGTNLEQRFSPLASINTANIGKLTLAAWLDLDTNRGQEATPIVVDGVMYVSTAWSKVYALNAVTGKQLWRYDPEVPGRKAFDGCCDIVSRGVAVKDGRVFLGAFDGRLIALDAKTGQVLHRFQTGGPIGGGVISYEIAGKQHVAVMSGRPSAFWWGGHAGAPTVFIFTLP